MIKSELCWIGKIESLLFRVSPLGLPFNYHVEELQTPSEHTLSSKPDFLDNVVVLTLLDFFLRLLRTAILGFPRDGR